MFLFILYLFILVYNTNQKQFKLKNKICMRENVLIFVLVMFKVGFFIKEIDQIFICLKVIVV
jgi:hypothetical protein